MTREEAIRILEVNKPVIKRASMSARKYVEAYEMALSDFKNNGEWIPCSERLPVLSGKYKISDDVLITNGFEIGMGYLVERKGKIFWHYYGSDFEVDVKDEDNDATAWMPLPLPYKGERENEK